MWASIGDPTTQACDMAPHIAYQQLTRTVTRIPYQNQEYRKQSYTVLNIHVTEISEYSCNGKSYNKNNDLSNMKT